MVLGCLLGPVDFLPGAALTLTFAASFPAAKPELGEFPLPAHLTLLEPIFRPFCTLFSATSSAFSRV